MSPDLRRRVDSIRAARIAREQATQQQANAQVRSLVICMPSSIYELAMREQFADPDVQKPVWVDSQKR